LANQRQERWKAPLPDFIESICFKRFGKTVPDKVLSLEAIAQEQRQKEAARKERKRQAREVAAKPESEGAKTAEPSTNAPDQDTSQP
jgi:hypothetical protein